MICVGLEHLRTYYYTKCEEPSLAMAQVMEPCAQVILQEGSGHLLGMSGEFC
jgi:hypothetical protein